MMGLFYHLLSLCSHNPTLFLFLLESSAVLVSLHKVTLLVIDISEAIMRW